MITLTENFSEKLPCRKSVFFTFDRFSKEMFQRVVDLGNCVYTKSTGMFEMPLHRLADVVHVLTMYTDVKFIRQKDVPVKTCSCDVSKFKVKPYQHQIDAINYGITNDSWMLLDDCGLGKTLTMIYLAEELHRREGLKHCLIVCGINSLKYTWESEIKKFSDKSYTILGQTITKRGKSKIASVADRCKMLADVPEEFFIITNIETLQNKEFIKAFRKNKSIDMVVLDEAHKCKNPSSASASTLLKLKAKHQIALTGTVIMTDPINAYVPLKWTKNTGSNLTQFKAMYNIYGGYGDCQVVGHKNLEILQDLISSCSLRRKKDEVLDLPDKTYLIEYVDLGKEQQELYKDVQCGIMDDLDKLDHTPTTLEEITVNMRLRQITACPSILSNTVVESAKMERLKDLVTEIVAQGDKVLVFNTFKKAAEFEEQYLSEFNPVLCTGSQTDAEIEKRKSVFSSDDSCKVMIATWQKMGTGHTLTAANYCIFVDTPWTYADFQQASDRIYRIGQNKKVTIITLIAKGTYDERVQQLLDERNVISGYLVDNEHKDEIDKYC